MYVLVVQVVRKLSFVNVGMYNLMNNSKLLTIKQLQSIQFRECKYENYTHKWKTLTNNYNGIITICQIINELSANDNNITLIKICKYLPTLTHIHEYRSTTNIKKIYTP